MRKPIHKFNNGNGATLCHKCSVIINTGYSNELFCEKHKYDAGNIIPNEEPKSKYSLKRLNDGLTKTGYIVQYIEWDENKGGKSSHDDIKIGRSLILEPRMQYTWLTTSITEIVEQREDYIKFKTQNSTYELITIL
jgi:hypothetical protein